jgi:tripartite ATP-independent transporter DctP family solute receptor
LLATSYTIPVFDSRSAALHVTKKKIKGKEIGSDALVGRRAPDREEAVGTFKSEKATGLTRRAVVGAALVAPAMLLAPRSSQAARFTLKLSTELVDTHPGVTRCREAAEAILKDTNGEVDIRIFPNSQLGGGQDALHQIQTGAVDLYPAAAAGLSAVVPVVSISSLGFAFKDYDQVWDAIDGALGTYLRGEIAKTGTIMALDKMWDNGFRQITNSSHPVARPDDLNGMKLRVPLAPLYVSMFKALGASPTGLSVTELYTALQSKLVDGQENPLAVIDLYKYYEVQKYCSVTNHIWDGWWLIANQSSWNRIPEKSRTIANQHLEQAALAMRRDVAELNKGAADRLIKHGMIINTADEIAPFRKKLTAAGFYTTWQKSYGEAAWSALEKAVGPLTSPQ